MKKTIFILVMLSIGFLSCNLDTSTKRPTDEEIKSIFLRQRNSCLEPQCFNKIKWISFNIVNSGETEIMGKKGIEVIFNGQIQLTDECNYKCGGGIDYRARMGETINYNNEKIFLYKLDKGWELMR